MNGKLNDIIYIYGLVDPRDEISIENIRYIGRTKYDMEHNILKFIKDSKIRKLPVYDWINMLIDNNLKPMYLVLEKCNKINSEIQQNKYIKELYNPNKLLNILNTIEINKPTDDKVYIYELINPLNNNPFYVGYSYNIEKRLYEHIYSTNSKNTYKDAVINKILNAGLKPTINIIDSCDKIFDLEQNMYEHEILEIKYIKEYKERGVKLTNLTEGGQNPPESKTRKRVYQYDKNLNLVASFESITKAAISMGTQPTRICAALNQKRTLSAFGYYWMGSINFNLKDGKQITINLNRKKHTIPIVQYSLDGIYLNEFVGQNEAERITGVNSKQINKALRLKGFDQAGGYMWFYKDKIPNTIKKYDGRSFTRKILSFDLFGNFIKEYDSIRDGAKDLNIDETGICKNLKGIISKTGKYRFEYK